MGGPTTRRRVAALALAVAAAVGVVGGASGGERSAAAATPTRFVTGWIPVWSGGATTNGIASLSGAPEVLAEVSPFAYSATGVTSFRLSGTQQDVNRSVKAVRDAGRPVVPSITDGTGRLVMSGILQDPAARAQHVAAIVGLVVNNGFDGIDLDYEGFAFTDGRASWAATQPAWAAFVQELGAALRAQAPPRALMVTVPPIWEGGNRGYWVYSPKEILPHVDRLRLMVYDWSVNSPGPISPMSWVNDVIATMSTVGPELMARVQIGVPTYGRSWATIVSGYCPSSAPLGTVSVLMRNAWGLAMSKGATPVRHASGEMTFTYEETFTGPRTAPLPPPPYLPPVVMANTVAPADPAPLAPALRLNPGNTEVTCRVRRTVFYPDQQSVLDRAQAAKQAGTAGIAIWALGYEVADLWSGLRQIAP